MMVNILYHIVHRHQEHPQLKGHVWQAKELPLQALRMLADLFEDLSKDFNRSSSDTSCISSSSPPLLQAVVKEIYGGQCLLTSGV